MDLIVRSGYGIRLRKSDIGRNDVSREHIINGEFQSDKYPWCKRGFVPLKLTDPNARLVLRIYAELRRSVDADFSDDLLDAISQEDSVHVQLREAKDLLREIRDNSVYPDPVINEFLSRKEGDSGA